ncbi:MAG: hypothetical protein ABR551_07815 [Gemmatimonadales bacterium]
MPDPSERRNTPRLQYATTTPARLYLNGEACKVLDVGQRGVRYELPALPVRPADSAIFEGELRLACGELVPVMGRVVRTHGPVAAARLDPMPISDLQLARERDFLRELFAVHGSDRRRWRTRAQPMPPHEPRRSEA